MFERWLLRSFELFLIPISLPVLFFQLLFWRAHRGAAVQSSARAQRAPVGEFAFEKAIAAYEDLLDAACKEDCR